MNNARSTLSKNLVALMDAEKPESLSQAALARKSKVTQRHIGRIIAGESSATLDRLDLLAKAFDMEPWQLLAPGLDPTNPPVVRISEAEQAFYSKLKELAVSVLEQEIKPYKT